MKGEEIGKALGDAIAANTTLLELDLSGNRDNGLECDAEFAKGFAVGLGANGVLTSLDVSKNVLCNITDNGYGTYDATGVTALADAIWKHQ